MKSCVAFFMFLPAVLQGQVGTLTGRVIESGVSTPVAGVNIRALSLDDTTKSDGTYSGRDGRYRLTRLQPGEYRVTFSSIGYRARTFERIAVKDGDTLELI